MNNKEHIARLKALLSDEAIVEFHIHYNACFTSEEKLRLLRERTAAVVKSPQKACITLQPPGTSIN